jgi:hypothetical protein
LLFVTFAAAGMTATGATAAAPEARARPPVPASLTALESNAEDLVDQALAHDRAGVTAKANALVASAGGTTGATLRSAGASQFDVVSLKALVTIVGRLARAGSYTSIELAANAVSGRVTDLYAHFADPVPVAVRRLDYLDREAQLRSLAGKNRAVRPIVARLAATWAPLRRSVISHGGTSVAAAYTRHVAAMQRLAPTPGAAFRREAVNGLNLVDELEGVFSR